MIERSFGNWPWLGLLPVCLLASTAISGSAMAAQEGTRAVDLTATIEPSTITLEKKQRLGPKDPVLRLHLVVVPDKRLPGKALKKFYPLFSKIVKLVSGTHPGADGKVSPAALRLIPQLRLVDNRKGRRAVVDLSFRNDPGFGRKLKARGWRIHKTKILPYKKTRYKFSAWIGDNRDEIMLGHATAELKLRANPKILAPGLQFHANFTRLPGGKIRTEGIPRGGKGRKLSRAAYDDFKRLVKGKLKRILEHLNRPRTALKASEMARIIESQAGRTLRFTRHLKIKWFGKPKRFTVHITATVGAMRVVGYPDTSDRDFADLEK